jgi:hypothetical protein
MDQVTKEDMAQFHCQTTGTASPRALTPPRSPAQPAARAVVHLSEVVTNGHGTAMMATPPSSPLAQRQSHHSSPLAQREREIPSSQQPSSQSASSSVALTLSTLNWAPDAPRDPLETLFEASASDTVAGGDWQPGERMCGNLLCQFRGKGEWAPVQVELTQVTRQRFACLCVPAQGTACTVLPAVQGRCRSLG